MNTRYLQRIAALTALAALAACADRPFATAATDADLAPGGRSATIAGDAPTEGAVIVSGTVKLGVNPEGALNVEAGQPSSMLDLSNGSSNTVVGLRYVPLNLAAIEQGCACEGWGVGDRYTGFFGGRAVAFDADPAYAAFTNRPVVESFTSSAASARSVVRVGSVFRVTHDFHPSDKSPNLIEATVTIQNISAAPVDMRYRRTMDWDIEPTPFSELITINTGAATPAGRARRLEWYSSNPFQPASPFQKISQHPFTYLEVTPNVDLVNAGPADLGAVFNFDFGVMAPGATRTFFIYYGAAPSETAMIEALGAAKVEAYSTARASSPTAPTTFGFGFREIEGLPLLVDKSPVVTPTVTGTMGLNGWYTSNVNVAWTTGPGLGSAVVSTSTSCATTIVTTNTAGTTYTCTATNTTGLSTTASVTLKRDATVPAITPAVAGTLGSNGWYTSNVGVTGSVGNAGPSGVSAVTCTPSSVTANTTGTLVTCTSTTGAGLTGTATTTIKRDVIAPTAVYSQALGAYSLTDTVTIGCTVADLGGSGIDASRTTCIPINVPAATLGVGTYTFTTNAYDVAGNVSAAASTRISVATISTVRLCGLTEQYADNPGIANSLCKKIENADGDLLRGDKSAFASKMKTYVSEVEGIAGKHMTMAEAATLVRLATALINNALGTPGDGGTGGGGEYVCSSTGAVNNPSTTASPNLGTATGNPMIGNNGNYKCVGKGQLSSGGR